MYPTKEINRPRRKKEVELIIVPFMEDVERAYIEYEIPDDLPSGSIIKVNLDEIKKAMKKKEGP